METTANKSQPQDSQRLEPQEAVVEGAGESSLTLDQLSQAFASMLGQDKSAVADASTVGEAVVGAVSGGQCELSPRSILEAALFVGTIENRPITNDEIAGIVRDTAPEKVGDVAQKLNAEYAEQGRPYEIVSSAEGHKMVLRPKFLPLRDKYYGRLSGAKLSQAAIEVLALVAYNEPTTSHDIAKLRGTPSGHILSHLVRRRLLRVERPTTKPRRAKYFTTDRFLQVFGLKSLADLPRSEELDK